MSSMITPIAVSSTRQVLVRDISGARDRDPKPKLINQVALAIAAPKANHHRSDPY